MKAGAAVRSLASGARGAVVRTAGGRVLVRWERGVWWVDVAELEDASPRPAPPLPALRSEAPRARLVVPPNPAPRTDLDLLTALDALSAQLYPGERVAFGRMLRLMHSGSCVALSYKQRAWAQEVGVRVGLNIQHPGEWRDVE